MQKILSATTAYLITSLFVCLLVLALAAPLAPALADDDSLYEATKAEFVKKFEKFKKDGLSADEVKKLTDQLLKAVGDKIDGTGTKTLLKTMNKQADNVSKLLKTKDTLEDLIDFVGDLYAMAVSDTPPDPVDAYKALSKGISLAAKLADKIPVLNIVAVPMLEAYAEAVKNGESHIEAINTATKAKNEAIALGWRSMDYGQALEATEMEEDEAAEPTVEELAYEAARLKRQEDYGDCLDKCRDEYEAYDQALTARAKAWKEVGPQKTLLEKDQQSVKTRRAQYHDLLRLYKDFRVRYGKALAYRDRLAEEMQLAKSRNNQTAYEELKKQVKAADSALVSRKENLRKDFLKVSRRHERLLEARARAADSFETYEFLIKAYRQADATFRKAVTAFEACIEVCLKTKALGIPACIGVVRSPTGEPLCIVRSEVVYDPDDDDIADVIWILVNMDRSPVKLGIEMAVDAQVSEADGTPVGRGRHTYWGSKVETGGRFIFHWDLWPDYRVVLSPANSEGPGAKLTIEPQ